MAEHTPAPPQKVTPARVEAMAEKAGFHLSLTTDPASGEKLVAGMVGDYPANIVIWQDWLLLRLDHPTNNHDSSKAAELLLAANNANSPAERCRVLVIDAGEQYVVRTDCSVDIAQGLTDKQLMAVIRQSLTLALGAMERFRLATGV